MTKITEGCDHLEARVDSRLKGLVTSTDLNKIRRFAQLRKDCEKFYLVVRTFKPIKINEVGYDGGNGKGIRGDSLVAVIKNGVVVTIMVSWHQDKRYFSDAPVVRG